ncbi:MAG: RDD family protein [Defluviitaleaceae bacterium]|nr:RDD family protein [Defluviitaleaceae bacterium]
MILVIMRMLATIVDILVFFIVIIGFFVFAVPILGEESAVSVVALLVVAIAVPSLLQYPFMKVGQTIGKAFFGLHIVSTNEGRAITPFVVFHREVIAKVMSCYLICIPVLFGKIGPHEVMTETRVKRI